MCLVCVDLIKQNMTILEAERNLDELRWVSKDSSQSRHYHDLFEAVDKMDIDKIDQLLQNGVVDAK